MSGDLTQVFGQDFDINSIEPASNFIPPGKLPCLIEKAELKENKKGTGHFVALVLSILEGLHKNRKLFVNINIANPNDQCVEIGRRTLRSLWDALSLPPIKPGEDHIGQLVDKVVVAHVRVRNEQNEVNVFSAPGAAPQPPIATAPVVPISTQENSPEYLQQQLPSAPLRPWEKAP